jgi:hypothetical protein
MVSRSELGNSMKWTREEREEHELHDAMVERNVGASNEWGRGAW